MTQEEIRALKARQRDYYRTGATLPISFRKEQLKKLYRAILAHETEITDALFADLGKSPYESFMCEIGITLTEISHMMKNAKKYARKRRVRTPLAQFPAKSYTVRVPYGNVLIMSPWNYPFLLTIEPLVTAIAAGNTAIVKPSAYAPATSALLERLIGECFPPEYVATVTGGREENAALLLLRADRALLLWLWRGALSFGAFAF